MNLTIGFDQLPYGLGEDDTMKKILLIDDEKPTLDMCGLPLGALGYDVLPVKNASEGVEIFQNERPQIVLTDIRMPGQDGFAILEQVKQIDPEAQVIVITGHGDEDLAGKAMEMGATDFINKPLGVDTLGEALKRAEENLKSNGKKA